MIGQTIKPWRYLFTKALRTNKRAEQGLTLLECLVAIVVVTAVISAITPPIMITVATRVQNRKADQARQLAQEKVDQIKRLVDTGTYSADDLRDLQKPYKVQEMGGGQICTAAPAFLPEQRVDINGDGKFDFWVQAFRTPGVIDTTTNRPVAFDLGVRVYAFFEGATPQPQNFKRASLNLTSAQGGQRNQPLIALYNRLAVSDTQNSLDNYRTITQQNPPVPCPQ